MSATPLPKVMVLAKTEGSDEVKHVFLETGDEVTVVAEEFNSYSSEAPSIESLTALGIEALLKLLNRASIGSRSRTTRGDLAILVHQRWQDIVTGVNSDESLALSDGLDKLKKAELILRCIEMSIPIKT
jgi:hypothetical protein